MTKVTNQVGAVQGDVVIIRILELPAGVKPTRNRTVALGETTGHSHKVVGGKEGYEDLSGWYFVVSEGETATLNHVSADGRTLTGEHDVVEMTPGIHFIPRVSQVEYDGENERRVVD